MPPKVHRLPTQKLTPKSASVEPPLQKATRRTRPGQTEPGQGKQALRKIANKALHKKLVKEIAKEIPQKAERTDNAVRAAQKRDAQNPLMKNGVAWDKEAVMEVICAATASRAVSLMRILGTPYEGWALPAIYTVMKWLDEDPELAKKYALAKQMQADILAEESIEIADDGRNDTYLDDKGERQVMSDVIARSRLRVDTRKWYASKLNSRKYGDSVKLSGDPDAPLVGASVELPADPVAAAEAYQNLVRGMNK